MKFILALLILLPLTGIAQTPNFPLDSATQRITYTEVVTQNGSQSELRKKAENWFATKFNSSKDVIQLKDDDKIIGKWQIAASYGGFTSVTISVLFKDNRYKYIITDLIYLGTNDYASWAFEDNPSGWKSRMAKYAQNNIKKDVHNNIIAVISDLKFTMSKKSVDDF